MEENEMLIIRVIFKFEDGCLYESQLDNTTTIYEVKKIISNSAHILKNSFTMQHKNQDYTNEYDVQTLQELFPNDEIIEFLIKMKQNEELNEENDFISIKSCKKEPCNEHMDKFLVLYCFTCSKSICSECFTISHNKHEVENKANYLKPAKILMEKIFANSFMFKRDPKISKYMESIMLRANIKTEIFDRLRILVNELEYKCINCLEFFSSNEYFNEKNIDSNLELLKKYCTSSFINFRNNIKTSEIIINEGVFLSLYNKLKDIKDYEISVFTNNFNKYKALNALLVPLSQEIKTKSNDISNILNSYINKDIYTKFKEDISKNIVDKVQEEDAIKFMSENANIPKSPLKPNITA